MTRSQLIEALARRCTTSRQTAEIVVEAVFGGMRASLAGGGRVEVRGFGSFKTKEYGGYQGRNPRTGEAVAVAPKVLPIFKPSERLLARLNKELQP
jgi:integration host factor subunit beta